jgi:alpha-L-fucosidase
VLKEDIATGQKIKSFTVQFLQNNNIIKEIKGNTVGHKRILTFPSTDADAIVINIDTAKATPLLDDVSAYLIDENLIEKN